MIGGLSIVDIEGLCGCVRAENKPQEEDGKGTVEEEGDVEEEGCCQLMGCTRGSGQMSVAFTTFGTGKPRGRGQAPGRGVWTGVVCFVLQTIRTGAMRVIHIPVKTEETQRLRIKFVLYCPICAMASRP